MNQWDKYAREYDKMMGETGDIPHRKLFNPAIQQFLGDVSGKIILDAGCGNGYWARKLSTSAQKVIGIDSSKELIKIARKRGTPSNVSFKVVDLTKTLPFKDDYFDIIISNMTLHYIPNIKTVAKEFSRVLKEGGKIIFSIAHPKYESYKNTKLKRLKIRTRFFTKTLGGRARLKEYYEPIYGYQKVFKKIGFKLTGLKEPIITKEIINEYPRYQKFEGIPRAAVFCWEK